MPDALSAMVTVVVIWAVFGTLFSLFIPLVFGKLSQLAQLDFRQVLSAIDAPLLSLQRYMQETFAMTTDLSLSETLASFAKGLFNFEAINSVVSSSMSFIASFLIAIFSITFITFFFLKENGLFYSMILTVTPTKYEDNVRRALDSSLSLLMRYFTGILFESTILMLVISIALICFGMKGEDAFFIGLFVGVMNVIPYVGPIISFSLSLFMGLVTPIGDFSIGQTMFTIGCVVIIAQGLDNFVLQPYLYSSRVKAHPLEIFLVILMAGYIGGVLGMLLAIPSYTILRVFAKEFFFNFKLVKKLTENI